MSDRRGFTIVELLIVIVVIAILAVITIVAFNGFQQRAVNNSIATTANHWVKILKTNKVDNGRWINAWTCLGEGYLYGVSGTDTTGTAQCRMDANGTGTTEATTFKNAMRQYVNGATFPNPPFVTAVNADGSWRRGLHYAYGGGAGDQVYIQVAYKGDIATCPTLQSVTGTKQLWTGNSMCTYLLGYTTDT